MTEIFLYAGALSYTISIEMDDDDVAAIKDMVERVPGFNHQGCQGSALCMHYRLYSSVGLSLALSIVPFYGQLAQLVKPTHRPVTKGTGGHKWECFEVFRERIGHDEAVY